MKPKTPRLFQRIVARLEAPVGVALVLLLLVLWEISIRRGWYMSISLAAPTAIFRAMWLEVSQGSLLGEFGVSLWRILAGFALASLLGVCFGLAMGTSALFNRLFEPITELLRPIPVSALVPIAILFFGIHSQMKIAMITYAATWPILVNTLTGVREVDSVLIDTARTFGVGRFERLFKIEIPAAAPYIASGMRISLAVALVISVVAEMIAGGDGIGSFILQSQRSFRVPNMYASVFLLSVMGYGMNRMFVATEQRVIFWSRLGNSTN